MDEVKLIWAQYTLKFIKDGYEPVEITSEHIPDSGTQSIILDYRTQGKSALRKAGRAGRMPRLSEKQRQQLEKHLVAGPERLGYETPLWTCPRVAHLIEQEFNVRYHEGHVWKILVGLGWSPQRPEGRARERNEEQILNWKKKVWPELKKKHAGKGVFSSSSTKAD